VLRHAADHALHVRRSDALSGAASEPCQHNLDAE
jgi:hypothetical protein